MVAQQVRDTLEGRVGIQMAGEGSNPSFRSTTTEKLFVSYLNFYYNLEWGCFGTPCFKPDETNNNSEKIIYIYLLI